MVIWNRPERGARGPKPAHTREDIAAVCVRIADAEGIEAVSMRRVAVALGTGTTSLYRYVERKDDLFDLMADAVAGERPLPALTGDWRADLRAVAEHMRESLRQHPWLAALSASRPSLGPNNLRLMEHTLSTVASLDLTADEMLVATGTLTTFVLGSALNELAEQEAIRRSGRSRDEWAAAQGAYGDLIISGGRFPFLARVMVEAKTPHDPDAAVHSFRAGVNCILDGLATGLCSKRCFRPDTPG